MRLVRYDENHKLHAALCLRTLVFSALKVETTAAEQAQNMVSCEKSDFLYDSTVPFNLFVLSDLFFIFI